MTEAEVDRLFRIWAYSPRSTCDCPDHNEKRKNVCPREEAWRAYCSARDKCYGTERKIKEFDMEAILDAFSVEHDD